MKKPNEMQDGLSDTSESLSEAIYNPHTQSQSLADAPLVRRPARPG